VANPNHVVFYDAGQTYRRALLSPDGDLCRFVVLAPDLASDLLDATFGTDRGHFPVAGGPVTAEVAMRIHLLGGWLERGQIDHDDAEDGLLDIVQRVLEGAVPPRRREAARRSSTAAARRMLAEDAKAYLSVRFAERGSIRAIAHALGASPFHLSRVFRAETGFTLQTYRDGLRLRCALERLTQGERDLARLAQDVGYASHSHLDVRFRTAFGRSPSTVRAA
jgi:AraC-like DNA-binding protein